MTVIKAIDHRRNVALLKSKDEALSYAVQDWIETAERAIEDHGYFAVALSGGSTPQAIYRQLANRRSSVHWEKVMLFWSDERAVSPSHIDSNYKMAMEAGFDRLPIPKSHIFLLKGEGDLESNAKEYEQMILNQIPLKRFDMIMLGMGADGHTASLFPKTQGLHVKDRLVIANFLPIKNVWRLSVTFKCIDEAEKVVVYVFGKDKASMLKNNFFGPYLPDEYPIQRIGQVGHPALFILDEE